MTTTADDMRRVLEIMDGARDNLLWAYRTLSHVVSFEDFITNARGVEESLSEMLYDAYRKLWSEADSEDEAAENDERCERFVSDTTGLPRNLPMYFSRYENGKERAATKAEVDELYRETGAKLSAEFFWNKYAKEYIHD